MDFGLLYPRLIKEPKMKISEIEKKKKQDFVSMMFWHRKTQTISQKVDLKILFNFYVSLFYEKLSTAKAEKVR